MPCRRCAACWAPEQYAPLDKKLEQAREDARETQKRCTALAWTFKGKKTAIVEEAR